MPFIYASSAATYGEGEAGYDDNPDFEHLEAPAAFETSATGLGYLRPGGGQPPPSAASPCRRCAWGYEFFNVYGPNEGHKGAMRSVVSKIFQSLMLDGRSAVRSPPPEYADVGEQMRDFVYVRDICQVVTHLLGREDGFGIFNVGSGEAHLVDLARAVFAAMGREAAIGFIDMPGELRAKYLVPCPRPISAGCAPSATMARCVRWKRG